jgi:UDP-glucose 4-epimerase
MGLLFSRIAVTGGAGLLGRYVVRELMADCDVTVIDLKPAPEDVAFVQADVRDLEAMRAALRGHDAVVHLAALDHGIVPQEEAYIDVNVRGTWHVMQAAEEAGVGRVVLASSVAAVGLGAHNLPPVLPIPTDVTLAPLDSYGLSKQACEAIARVFVRRGPMNAICLRPCLIAQPEITYGIAKIAAIQDGVALPPAMPGASWRDLREELSPTRAIVSPEDVARAFRAALSAPGIRFGAYFVTGPDSCTTRPTIDCVAEGYGTMPKIARPALYADDPCATAYDLAPALGDLGWEPRDHWRDHLARVIAAA